MEIQCSNIDYNIFKSRAMSNNTITTIRITNKHPSVAMPVDTITDLLQAIIIKGSDKLYYTQHLISLILYRHLAYM